jgi:tRNA(fMet)-specific endonuclease VapC
MYLLDTNILSVLVRDPQAEPLFSYIAEVGDANLCTSVIVAAELRYGAARKNSAKLTERVAQILSAIQVVDLTETVSGFYGEIRAYLERQGEPIGANDLFIGAHALSLGAVLVTDNEREFRRITDLRVENWLSAPPQKKEQTGDPFLAEYDKLSATEQAEIAALIFEVLRNSVGPGESVAAFGARLQQITDGHGKETAVSSVFAHFSFLVSYLEMSERHGRRSDPLLAVLREAASPAALIETYRRFAGKKTR